MTFFLSVASYVAALTTALLWLRGSTHSKPTPTPIPDVEIYSAGWETEVSGVLVAEDTAETGWT